MGSTQNSKKGHGAKARPVKTSDRPLRVTISRTHKPDGLGLEEWQRELRKQFGEGQDFRLENRGDHPIFSDFSITNPHSGRTYKVAIRGNMPGENYCSCPDFAVNDLGMCKHIAFTLNRLAAIKDAECLFVQGYRPPYSEIFLTYGLKRTIRFRPGTGIPKHLLALVHEFFDQSGHLKEDHLLRLPQFLGSIDRKNGHEVRCYNDVLTHVAEHQDKAHRLHLIDQHLRHGIQSPIMERILKADLYPYQKEGALFAVRAGRCLIGDDMGLGKTIQALAASELMARLFHIGKVLIISPTSLKYQWKGEIETFTARKAVVIEGLNRQRRALYESEGFYKLVNYDLVWRDIDSIRQWAPDLIILDEAQRIKNWKTRTANYVKQLESTFAIVLTGTPIENRVEELHSIMEFIDRRHFGPLYRFIHNHRITDDSGKVMGYQRLESIRGSLKDVMIRRKKGDVLKQLPERTDKHFFVPMTKEQRDIHDEHYETVVQIVAKWRRHKFLSEADQRRLQIALSIMRMAADNTYLVDKQTFHGPKIDELAILLREIVLEGGEKVVIFSQWLRMTELVERVLKEHGIGYVHLNGTVPAAQRRALMTSFKEDLNCKVFLSTDAGGVGLNLQSGSVVINLDIPWNPAVLEQRIGRVHRLGQKRMVRVINFVTKGSIEERILDILRFKKSLFSGALDEGGDDVVMIGESQLRKIMETVEKTTDNLEKGDERIETQDQLETAGDVARMDRRETEDAQTDAMPSLTHAPDPLAAGTIPIGQLLIKGAELLATLGKALAASGPIPGDGGENKVSPFIGKDETTGKTYLRLPLPEPEIVQNILSTVSGLLAGFIVEKK